VSRACIAESEAASLLRSTILGAVIGPSSRNTG
jgi:hypothetical protein